MWKKQEVRSGIWLPFRPSPQDQREDDTLSSKASFSHNVVNLGGHFNRSLLVCFLGLLSNHEPSQA